MIITFSGVDGSGKTTQARYVVEMLEREGFQVNYIHMIQWTLVNRIGRILYPSGRQKLDTDHTVYNNHVFLILRRLIILLDVFRFRFLGSLHYLDKRFLVCDRYFYDLGVQALYTGILKQSEAFGYWKLAPVPALSIMLDVPPEFARDREGEHPLIYYQVKRKLYLDHATRWGSIVVDSIELETTRQKINEIIYDFLVKRGYELN